MEAAITPRTKMLISESPTNPHLTCIDLEQFAHWRKPMKSRRLSMLRWPRPAILRPLSYGVDYVLHSATKYLGGHNDLLAGCITGSKEKLDDVRNFAASWVESIRHTTVFVAAGFQDI